MQTTNALIDNVAKELDTLIGWANADWEASLEGGYHIQAKDDRRRVDTLTEIKYMLTVQCRKYNIVV